jgi:hypothetical protein
MALPIKPLATDSVEIAGELVEFRAMSRSEALRMNAFRGREDEAEVFVLVCGTGCTEAEAEAFRSGNDTDTAGLLIDGILVLSGLATSDDDPKA